jgi:plastocyanin
MNLKWCVAAMAVLCGGAGLDASAGIRGTSQVHGRPTADVVVWLEAPRGRAAAAARVTLDQRNLQFKPHVLAVQVGTIVDFPNNDRVFHNVFSFRDGKVFDLGMYPVGAMHHVTFDKPGLSRIFCNIHPAMAAYVMAVDSPYFAVSDDLGAFAIASVEPGTYRFHAWRPGATEITGTLVAGEVSGALAIAWP